MTDQLPAVTPSHAAKGKGPHKSTTVAERVVWMTRTSDIHGSHIKTDLESYMSLIRRKIQERCSTTGELITQIRRNKISDSAHVTPNEFRFTLIKFGIILPQPLVDRIFNVFDSDRSGTMDFDEFAMWIMNSEFRPTVKGKKDANEDSPTEALRKKLHQCLVEHRPVFRNMKPQLSFLQFISDVNRAHMPITEREARTAFQLLDPKDTGFINSLALISWAETGVINLDPPEAAQPKQIKAHNLEDLIAKVVGRNSKQLESSFSHIELGHGTRIPFEEFRRCMLNAGVGKNTHDVRQLFNALGGASGMADIDLFFRSLSPMVHDPRTEVSVKQMPPSHISTSRADRRLRDALRKCFKEVRTDLEAQDPASTGFVAAETLYRVLVKRCTPMTFQDFRFIVQQIRKEPGTGRIDYHHFLHGYNPVSAPHFLEGSSTLKNYVLDSSSTASNMTLGEPPRGGLSVKVSTAGSNEGRSSMAAMPSPLHITKRNKATDDISVKTSIRNPRSNNNNDFGEEDDGGANSAEHLKRVWHTVLRECHRADPDRSGQVSRNIFISALERANLSKTMSAEEISKLADSYALSNGLVNYLLCFRNYLQDMTGMTQASFTKSRSMTAIDTSSMNKSLGRTAPDKAVHPWEFDYKRERHPEHPYWQQATAMPRDPNLAKAMSQPLIIPSAHEKAAQDLNMAEKDAVLGQYPPKLLTICASAYQQMAPVWRTLRNLFKKMQITSQRGNILTTNFITILENNGVMLGKSDLGAVVRAFRGPGLQEVVKYDEFLRVCLLVKDRVEV